MDREQVAGKGAKSEEPKVSDRLSEATSSATLEDLENEALERKPGGHTIPPAREQGPSPDGQFDDAKQPGYGDTFQDRSRMSSQSRLEEVSRFCALNWPSNPSSFGG